MPTNPTTLLDEMVSAARGIASLVVGDRRAAGYFDFSQRGLVGSFIAFFLALLVNVAIALFTGGKSELPNEPHVTLLMTMFIVLLLYVLQNGAAALMLRQIKRTDGLVPYLVTYNWLVLFLVVISTVLSLVGVDAYFALAVIAIAMLVIYVNTARLIVTLTPLQIVGFIASQIAGGLIGLVIVGMMMPLPAGTIPAA